MNIFEQIQSEVQVREKREGILPADLLDLSPPVRRLMTHITRAGEMTVEAAAEYLEEPLSDVQHMLDTLTAEGYLEREKQGEDWVYRTRFARKRGHTVPAGIWSALED
jgi:DNA-binding MarR family transcriptional regulator